jgi:hypothetical protein
MFTENAGSAESGGKATLRFYVPGVPGDDGVPGV